MKMLFIISLIPATCNATSSYSFDLEYNVIRCFKSSAANKQFIQKLSRFRGGFFAGNGRFLLLRTFQRGGKMV